MFMFAIVVSLLCVALFTAGACFGYLENVTGWPKFLLGLAASMILLGFSVSLENQNRERKHRDEIRDTYYAWVKYTGNEKELSFEEWKMVFNKN